MPRSSTTTRPQLPCRECGTLLSPDASRCRSCGCQAPFSCTRCDKALSSVSLNVRRSHKYPSGAYSAEGEPLCAEHRPTRCYQCDQIFEAREMQRRQVGVHADTNLRHGMAPRMEKVYGSFCPDCYRKPKEPKEEAPTAPNYALLWVLLAVGAVVLLGVLVLILMTRH